MKKLLPFLILFLPFSLRAETQVIGGQFLGLNNGDSSFQISDNETQSCQDVDITESGFGIKKRTGYASSQTIGVSSHPVLGGYYFRDASGNDDLVHTNDTKIFKSASGAAYSAFVTTDTSDSYYDFTDSQGYLWRANSNHDQILKYDGTTVTYYPNSPKGDQIEAMPDRLVISGSTSSPNTVYFSAAADFTDFTTGILETSAFTESFGLPGQKITAIKYAFGRLLVWTKNTLSFWTGTSQFDGQIQDISTTIGTDQPDSIVYDSGLVYWQAQDKNFYSYDGNIVAKLSRKISGSVTNFTGGAAKALTQTSQSDFDGGASTYVSPDSSPGDVIPSAWTTTDTSFGSGTTSNTSIIGGVVYLSTNDTNVVNNSFESGSGTDADNWAEISIQRVASFSAGCGTINPDDGSWMMKLTNGAGFGSTIGHDILINILDANGTQLQSIDTGLIDNYTNGTGGCQWGTISQSLSSYAGRYIKLQIAIQSSSDLITSDVFLCSGGTLSFDVNYGVRSGAEILYTIDKVVGGRSTTYSGTFTSQALNTSIGLAAWLASSATWTTNGHSVSVQTQSSSDGSSWNSAVSWTTGTAPSSAFNQYLRYVVTLSTGGTTNGTALPHFDSAAFSARASSGTFISSAINVGSNISSWGNFAADQTLNSGTIGYYMRGNKTSASLSTTSWTAVTRNATIGISTNPYVQVRATFTITAATQIPTLSAFTINWNEGNLVRSYGVPDKDHRILWALGENGSSVPNATYIYDTRFDTWLKYSVPFSAPAKVDNSIYFGSPSTGNVYNWPSGTSDNGSAITAFWKSKDFIGVDPFTEKDYLSYSFIALGATSNLDVTYTINTSSAILTNYNLTDSNGRTFRNVNTNLPSGKYGLYFNLKFGNDDADAPFEVYALRYDYKPRPWRVLQ